MTLTTPPVLTAFVDNIREIFGNRLRAVVLYGPHARPGDPPPGTPLHLLVLTTTVTYEDLAACASRMATWRRRGLATPLVLGVEEFTRSLDAFPLEYGDILAHHRVIVGDTPFAGLAVRPEDRRRACEVQAKSHLLHLREGFLETGRRPRAVALLIERSAPAFAALLAELARLTDEAASTPAARAGPIETAAGMPADVVERLLALARGARLSGREALRLYPRYLDAVTRLADYVDRWPR